MGDLDLCIHALGDAHLFCLHCLFGTSPSTGSHCLIFWGGLLFFGVGSDSGSDSGGVEGRASGPHERRSGRLVWSREMVNGIEFLGKAYFDDCGRREKEWCPTNMTHITRFGAKPVPVSPIIPLSSDAQTPELPSICYGAYHHFSESRRRNVGRLSQEFQCSPRDRT